jgi:hypothetical protein
MDPSGGVHYGTPPSEQRSTYDPDSYFALRGGVDTGFMGGCQAGDFIKENAQKVIQDSAENLAMALPIGDGAEGFEAINAALKARKLDRLLEARRVARNALNVAEDLYKDKVPGLKEALHQAEANMVQSALDWGMPSPELRAANDVIRQIEAKIRELEDILKAAKQNYQRADQAAMNCR